MVTELDGQDLGVDGAGIDRARLDQADGPLMEAGFDHRAEEARPGAEPDPLKRVNLAALELVERAAHDQLDRPAQPLADPVGQEP